MSVNYREPQWLLPNEKNLQYPAAGATQGSGLTADRHSLYSMDFDGVDDIITIDTSTGVDFSNPFSVSLWAKWTAADIIDNTAGIIQFAKESQTYSFMIGTGVGATNNTFSVSWNNNNYEFGGSYGDGNWHNIIVTGNGVNWSGVKIYIDGTDVTSSASSTSSIGINSTVTYIGQNTYSGNRQFKGLIDEVAAWSREISSNEVTTLYDSGSPSNPMLLSGKPVAYYPLGEQARKPGTANWRFPNEVLQGQAIDFDGTDYIDFDTLDFGTGNFSISGWINSATSTNSTIIGNSSSSSYIRISSFGGGTLNVNGNTMVGATISTNQWVHFLITRNGTTQKAFINGVEKSSVTNSANASFNRIGHDSTYFFNGKISNIAIWDTDQSTNIANIYNYGAPQTSYTVTPTAWYKLDKTSEYAGLNANWHNALDFNGSSNYLTIPSTNFAGSNGEVSYSFWLNPDTYTHPSNNDYGYIFSGVDLGAGGIAMSEGGSFTAANGTLNAGMVYYFDGSSVYIVTSALTENVWSHVALVFNSGGEIKSYVNGQLDTTLSSITTPYKSTFENIGKFYNSTHYLNGQYSNFSVFNQAISAEDVLYLYNGGTPQTNISFEPTSWWKLDNLTTGIQDSGSASNNGTNNGATAVSSSVAVDQWNFDNAVQSQTPNWSSALEFKPIDSDYIRIPDNDSLSFGNGTTDQPFSLSIWANLNDVTNANLFAKRGSSNQREYQFNFASNNKLYFSLFSQLSGSYISRRVDTDLSSYENQWIHLVATYDGSSTVSGIKIYINGSQEDNATSSSGTYVAMSNGPRDLFLGRFSSDYLDGELSNAQIYNVELSSSQVETLYNNGQPESTASLSPMSWWKLDNTTTGIQDSGSASNNGTLENSPTEIQTNVWTPRLNGESDTLPSTALVSSDLQFNSAYSNFSMLFDASSTDRIVCGDAPTLSQVTLSAWVKPDNPVAYSSFFGTRNGSTTTFPYLLGTDNTGKFRFVADGLNIILSNDTFSNNTWYHVVGVADGSNLKMYVNGVLQTNTTTYTAPLATPDNKLMIGAQYDTDIAFEWNGNIDECSMWYTGLNQSQITSIYNNGYPSDLTALSPNNWWRLGEDAYYDGTDFTIPNKISGAPNGTSDNMPATALVADAPGSYAAGLGSSLALADRVGDAPLSTANSLSFNMTPVNRVSYPAGYTPTQVDNVYSMAFDGINDYVDVGTVSQVNSATACTLCYWGKKTASNKYLLFGSQITSTNGIWLSWWSDGNVYFSPRNGSFSSASYSLSFDTNWHHFAGVYDGSSAKIYIDGNLVSTNTTSIPSSLSASAGTDFNIGYLQSQYTSGSMDEVAIFDYALSARQIKQDIYNGTTSGKTADLNNNSNLTAPIAWYRMGD